MPKPTTRRTFRALVLRSLSAISAVVALLSSATEAAATDATTAHGADASSAGAENATHAQADAKAHYELGVEAYRERRFEHAIELFLSADRLAPRPALAFNVARAYEKLREPARALEYYREYLRRGASASNREEVAHRVRELQAKLAERGIQQVTVRSQPSGAAVSIDGKLQGTTPWTGELPIGTHQLQAGRQGRQSVSVTLTLEASRAQNLELVLPAAGTAAALGESERAASTASVGQAGASPNEAAASDNLESGELRPWPWVAIGAGGAALVAAGAFELLRRSAESDAENARYQPAYYDAHERMRSHQTTARVLVGVGAALALTGGILVLVGGAGSNTKPSPIAVGCDTTTCMGTWMETF